VLQRIICLDEELDGDESSDEELDGNENFEETKMIGGNACAAHLQ
jgi:hypothetical protein